MFQTPSCHNNRLFFSWPNLFHSAAFSAVSSRIRLSLLLSYHYQRNIKSELYSHFQSSLSQKFHLPKIYLRFTCFISIFLKQAQISNYLCFHFCVQGSYKITKRLAPIVLFIKIHSKITQSIASLPARLCYI